MKIPIYQAAGVRSLEEAEMLIGAGFNCIGFPLRLDYHTPDVSESLAKNIIEKINSSADTVLITYLDKASEIVSLAGYLGVSAVQIHGKIELRELKAIHDLDNRLVIIKSLVVKDNNILELKEQVHDQQGYVDYFITDTFDKSSGASGATGKTHDWAISRELRDYSLKPLILAGGLNPENVTDAVNFVRPYGVDVHTSIENADGSKDKIKSREFILKAQAAYDSL